MTWHGLHDAARVATTRHLCCLVLYNSIQQPCTAHLSVVHGACHSFPLACFRPNIHESYSAHNFVYVVHPLCTIHGELPLPSVSFLLLLRSLTLAQRLSSFFCLRVVCNLVFFVVSIANNFYCTPLTEWAAKESGRGAHLWLPIRQCTYCRRGSTH